MVELGQTLFKKSTYIEYLAALLFQGVPNVLKLFVGLWTLFPKINNKAF